MPNTQRQPIDLDAHRGSRWSMHIRDGLVDAKHRAAMGEAIWLYLYLHKSCAAKTGSIKHYRHQDAADTLGMTRQGVMLQMERLEDAGYVTVCRHQHGLSVQIVRYAWQPRQHTPPADVESGLHLTGSDVNGSLHLEEPERATERPQMSTALDSDVNSSIPPSIFTSRFNGNDSVGADAPAQTATPQQDTQDQERTAKAAAKEVKRQADARSSFEKRPAWVRAFCRRAAKSLGWDTVKPTTLEGWAPLIEQGLAENTARERERFGRWLFSNGWFANGHGFQLHSQLVKEMDAWHSSDMPEVKSTSSQPSARAPVPSRITTLEETLPCVCACGAKEWDPHNPACRKAGLVQRDHMIPTGEDWRRRR